MYKLMEQPGSMIQPLHDRGSSSLQGTRHLCSQLPDLFAKYQISSMFDAGSNDGAWQLQTIAQHVNYMAGEHDAQVVEYAKKQYPDLDIRIHDMTCDPFPAVDLLFVRDANIHMNNFYKRQLLRNWLSSSISWLLITQIQDCLENLDSNQIPGEWYFAETNWHLDPWNFPEPLQRVEDLAVDTLIDQNYKQIDRFMCLWHRDQIKGLSCVQ